MDTTHPVHAPEAIKVLTTIFLIICCMTFLGGQSYEVVFSGDIEYEYDNAIFESLLEDEYTGEISIGFDFIFFGNTYSSLWINQNGYVTFDEPGIESTWDPQMFPDTTGPNNIIAGVWHDVEAGFADISYETVGTAPNRKFIISSYGDDFCYGYHDFQIKLYETSNVIELHMFEFYGYCDNATQGLENETGTEAVVVADRNQSAEWDSYYELITFIPSSPNDAGILTNLTNYCEGTQDIRTVVQNFGNNDITSLNVNWTWNGVTQPPVILNPTIFEPGQAGVVTLGQQTLVKGVQDTLVAWTSSPNGIMDPVPANDSAVSYIRPGMAGIYTIGGTDPDFTSFGGAVAALQDTGICDTVWMHVRPGTYTEQVTIGHIPGAGTGNNVVIFRAENGDSSSVTLRHESLSSSSNYVIAFNNGHHIILEHLSIQSLGSPYNRIIDFQNYSFDNIVRNCALLNQPTTNSSTSRASIYSGDGSYAIQIRNNRIENGSYGFYHDHFEPATGIVVHGNSFLECRGSAIYLREMNGVTVSNNYISCSEFTNGIQLYDDNGVSLITGNEIILENGTNGIVLSSVYPPLDDTTYISNNAIHIGGSSFGTSTGISLFGSRLACVFNNINVTNTGTSSKAVNFDASNSFLTNNIIVNTGGATAMFVDAAFGNVIDRNAYWVTGPVFAAYNSLANDIASLEDWQDETGYDSTSLFLNPGFLSPTDLHVSNNALNGVAIPFGDITIDIDGDLRNPVNPDIGSDEFMPSDDDVAVSSVLSPTAVCIGIQDVEVVVTNLGGNSVSSFDLNWSVNGVVQAGVQFSETLNAEGDTAHINLGSYSFSEATDTIVVWTSLPNGNPDTQPGNDTLLLMHRNPLQGIYTVGGLAPDFVTLAEAFDAMQSYTICGPVTIRLRDGVYPGQIEIDSIPGASSVDTILIESESGDSSAVRIEVEGLSNNNNFLISIQKADYLTFSDLTFYTAGNPVYSVVFNLTGGVQHFRLQRCLLEGPLNTNSGNLVSIQGAGNNYLKFANNTFIGGTSGLRVIGQQNTGVLDGTKITGNRFFEQSAFSVDLRYHDDLIITHNRIENHNESVTSMDGIRAFNLSGNGVIAFNTILLDNGGEGGYINSVNNFVGMTGDTRIYNNLIYTESGQALRLWNSERVHVYYNNVYAAGATSNDDALEVIGGDSVYVKNNILVSSYGEAISSTISTPPYAEVDYNDLYTVNGPNLAIWANAPYTDLSSWQSGTGFDANGLSVDPQFYGANDLHILEVSLNAAATPISGIVTDYDGDPRDPVMPDIGADEIGAYADDAGIVSLMPTMPFAFGEQEVKAVLRNFGSNTLSSASIAWEVNNVAQSDFSFTGSLSSLESDTIVLGVVDFNLAEAYSIKAWTSSPNGGADSNPSNDTIFQPELYAAVTDTLTIGGVDPDIDSISGAMTAMYLGGVLDSVDFVLRSGTYDVALDFIHDDKLGCETPVRFRSESGDPGSVVLVNTSFTDYTVHLDGADGIWFEDVTIQTVHEAYHAILIENGAHCNVFSGCILEGVNVASTSGTRSVVYSGTTVDTANTFVGNEFLNGSYNLFYSGADAPGTRILNNVFQDAYYRGAYVHEQNGLRFEGNVVTSTSAHSSYQGVFINSCGPGLGVVGNQVLLPGRNSTALQISYSSGLVDNRQLIANNYLRTGNTSNINALYVTYSSNMDVVFNTVKVEGTGTGSNAYAEYFFGNSYSTVRNNIFYNEAGGRAMNFNNSVATDTVNYNDLYTTGTNLVRLGSAEYVDLPTWQGATAQSANSLNEDPMFTDPVDFAPTNASLNGSATPLANVTTDIEGESRDLTEPDIGCDEFSLFSDDVGILSINYPVQPFPSGLNTVFIKFVNNGDDTLTTMQVDWEVNGVAQPTYLWTGLLPSAATYDSLDIGQFDFAPFEPYNVKVWVSAPNGVADGLASNDTLELQDLYAGLAGSYTIGGFEPDFDSLGQAVAALMQGGAAATVTFNIRPGIYLETLEITEFPGSSCETQVVFQSETRDSSDVELTNLGVDATVVTIDGADGLVFRDLTLRSVNPSYRRVLDYWGGAHCIEVSNCELEGYSSSTTSNVHAVIYSNVDQDTASVFRHNKIHNGSYGIYGIGGKNSVVEGNDISNVNWRGIWLNSDHGANVNRNIVKMDINTGAIGIELFGCNDAISVIGNKVDMLIGYYALSLQSCFATGDARGVMANNFGSVGGTGQAWPYVVQNCDYQDIVFNSGHTYSTTTNESNNSVFYIDNSDHVNVLNNNFHAKSPGYAAWFFNNTNITSDHNNYSVTGNNIGWYHGSLASDLATWQANSGQDANSVSSNPVFMSDTDLHVSNVLLNSGGLALAGISDDIDGETRDTLPDIGADEFVPPASDDAGIMSYQGPVAPFADGLQPVEVIVKNFGGNSLTSTTVRWVVNGVEQPAYAWTGNLLPGGCDTISVGLYDFAPYSRHDIIIWSDLPNGVPDSTNVNDTIKANDLYPALIGTYTVGGVLPDFVLLTQLERALNRGGTLGPVQFDIRPGSFDEQLKITDFPRANASDKVTFRSETGDNSDVLFTRTFNGANYIVQLSGARHIVFRNIAFSTQLGLCIDIADGSSYIDIVGCSFETREGINSNSYTGIYSGSTTDSYVSVDSCVFDYGAYGIYFAGSSGGMEIGNAVLNSSFRDARIRGIQASHQKGLILEGNTISNSITASTGIYMLYCDSTWNIVGNNVVLESGGTALSIYDCHASNGDRALVANNHLEVDGGSYTAYGVFGYSNTHIDYFYNTIRILSATVSGSVPFESQSSSGGDIAVRNCIFANFAGNYAFRTNWFVASTNCSMDFCNFYSTGSPLAYWYTDYNDLPALQAATADNFNSINIDPIFINATGYKLAQAAIDGGADMLAEVSVDIEGDPRNVSTPDIGADEFTLPPVDVAVTEIISPETYCGLSASETLTVQIQNRGTLPQHNFDVGYSLNGDLWVNELVNDTVNPGESIEFTFSEALDLSTVGTYLFDAAVSLTGDSEDTNDTIFGVVVEHIPALTDPVTNMIPLDGETDLDKTVSLSWAPAPNATRYDVYIWPENEEQPASPQISDLVQINVLYNNLNYATTYNWQVVAENVCDIMLPGPVQTFTIRSLPDLVVDTVISPPSAFSGQIVEFEWQVNNAGDGNSLGTLWSDAVYLSTDATLNTSFDTYLGAVQNLTALDTGETYSQTGMFTIPDGFTGNYYVFIYADRWNSLIEENNSNNWERTPEPMAITLTPAPDLIVTSVTTPTTVFSGESISVSYTVKNNGSGAVPPGVEWSDRLVFGDDPLNPVGFNLTFTDVSVELEPDSTYTIMTTASLPEAISGTYYMHAVADFQNDVYEFSAEGNNSNSSVPINVILAPPPDLVVTDVMINDTVSNRERLTMEWVVTNQGGGDATEDYWQDVVYLSQSPVYNTNFLITLTNRYQYEEVPSLGMYTASREVIIPANISGEYYVYVVTDKRDDVFEFMYEDNNIYRLPEPILIANADLQPVDLIAPDSVLAESAIAMSWQRVNNGPGGLYFAPSYSYVYLSEDEILDEDDDRIFFEYAYYTQKDAGDTTPVAVTVTIPPQYNGDYYLILFEDATNSIHEDTAESNNIVARSIHISPGPSPDLVSVSFNTPDTALAGSFVDLDYTTVNGGTEDVTTNWSDRVFISFLPSWDPEFAIELNQVSQSIDLDPGDTLNTVLTSLLDLYTQENIYYFYVLSDFNEQIYEGFAGEMNNVFRSDPVYVKAVSPVDLSAESLTTSTQSFASGQPAQFDWVTMNNSSVPTTVNIWSDRLFLSLDTVLSANDIPLGTAASAGGALSPGATRSNTISSTLPNGVSGQYYVLVRTDIDNVSLDQDTTNNVNTIRDGGGVPQPIDIILSPSPDLVVTSWSTPATAIAGQPMVVQYSVRNQGNAQAVNWVDKIYISEDNTISPDDVQFYVSSSQPLLAADSVRRDTVSSDVLSSLIGNYIIILQTDAQNAIYEHNGEGNNILTRSIEIVAPPPSDLSVSSVFHPVNVIAGENIDVSWVTQNTGTFPAAGTYREVVYISPDTAWSPDDRIFGIRDDVIYLPPGGTENVNLTSNVTGVATGDYYAIVQTDARQNILESDETNNFGYSEVPMNVDVKPLIIDSLTFDSLTNFTELYYKLQITPDIEGETIIIDLEGDSLNGINQLYARFGQMPTLADFDYSFDNPLASDQQILLPSVEVGTYYILVYGQDIAAESQEVSLLARIVDYEILSATPKTGVRNTQVTVRIRGTKLNGTQQVRLRRSFPWVSVDASEVLEVNDNLIYATFDLTGVEVDTYALDLVKADSSLAFIDDFVVTAEGQVADLQLNSELPTSVPPRPVPVKIVLTYINNGGADAVDPVAEVEAPFGNVIAFTLEDLYLDNGQAILEVPLMEENGPPGRLRPGASGRIELYAWSTPVAVFAIGLK